MKDKFQTPENKSAIFILESFGYVVNFNNPSRETSETTTITIYKDGQKDMFLSSNLMLDIKYAVKFIEGRSFDKGHAKGKEDLINNFKTLLQL